MKILAVRFGLMLLLGSWLGGRVLRVTTHHTVTWPGVTVRAPHGAWNLSSATTIKAWIKNTGRDELKISLRVDNPGADGWKHCLTRQLTLKPGQRDELEAPLPYADKLFTPVKLFGMRQRVPQMRSQTRFVAEGDKAVDDDLIQWLTHRSQ
jgi:hypothetical protein